MFLARFLIDTEKNKIRTDGMETILVSSTMHAVTFFLFGLFRVQLACIQSQVTYTMR